jgi:hypothetical protein
VTRSSALIVETALADSLVVVYNTTGLADPVPFVELRGTVCARNPSELRVSLEGVLLAA